MYIVSFFTDSGIPKTGLSPTIDVREIPPGTLVVSGSNMVEAGGGVYYYNHTGYDPEKDYAIISDGGSSLTDTERYKFAGNENYVDDIENVLDNSVLQADLKRTLGLVQENYYIDQTNYTTYEGSKLMTSGRMRVYSNASSVGTDSDVTATYQINTSWSNGEMTTYKVTKV